MVIALCIILGILILLFLLIGNYFCNIAFNPKVSKNYILRALTKEEQLEEDKNNIEGKEWLKEFAEEVDITSVDDLRLHGYMLENPIKKSNIWVILVHGYMGRAYEMVDYAKEFMNMGYNTLLVDLRAHGKSEGKYIGMGWKDHYDILKWIEKLQYKCNECEIILYGISMGAATVMMTTGEKLPANVKLCIEDCGYSSVWMEFKSLLRTLKPCISHIILNIANFVGIVKVGYRFKKASSIEQIKKSSIPILFIHGNKDNFVPFEMLEELYHSAQCPKEKLVIDGAAHAVSSKVNHQLYWKTIKKFIQKYK